MAGFIDNTMDFCKGFESVLPVGKVSKFIAVTAFNFVWNSYFHNPYNDSSFNDFKNMRVTISDETYANINGR